MAKAKSGKRTSSPKRPPLSSDPHVAKALGYIDDVLAGRVPACKWVRLACQRQRDDLERYRDHPVFYWDEDLAGRACRFIECLPHIEGPKAFYLEDGTPNTFELEPWQCFVVTTVFGWRRHDTGGRRFRRVYIEVPRGNGKSALSSGIALYGLTSDGEAGPQIYSAATTREQAAIVFNTSKSMLLKREDFAGTIGAVTNKHEILCPKNNGRFIPLSREAKSLDGKNLHVGVVDELHAHKTREVYDVLETAMAKRISSLLWIITTAGSDTSGICYEVRTYSTKLLERTVEDDSFFGIIFTIDEGDDWTEESSWIKANPNWGVSVMPDEIASLARKAMHQPSAASNFKTKHLNVWVNADQAWMEMRAWDRCADPGLSDVDFEGQDVVEGNDLASKVDIAARAKVFWRDLSPDKCPKCGKAAAQHPEVLEENAPAEGCKMFAEAVRACNRILPKERHYYGFVQCYLPEGAVENARNAQYAGWVEEGRIKTTPGDVTDFGVIRDDVLLDSRRFRIREFAFDPWQSAQMAQELEAEGIQTVELRPSTGNFSAPMKELDALVRSCRFHHDGNPVVRWMVSNVVCHTDTKDNIYPRKQRPENKIDGVVALIMALARAMVASAEPANPYEERGLLST
jgi:phage terminase large subunit-like protein